jgi:hypothetical protein
MVPLRIHSRENAFFLGRVPWDGKGSAAPSKHRSDGPFASLISFVFRVNKWTSLP